MSEEDVSGDDDAKMKEWMLSLPLIRTLIQSISAFVDYVVYKWRVDILKNLVII
jgi:hypothetical protein